MPIRQVAVRPQLGAAPLQLLDQRHRLPVQRRVLGRRGGAEVRLQRDVAEILQRENAELVRVAEDRGDRQRDLLQQLADVGERQRREVDRPGVQRQHDRRAVGRDDPEVPPVGRVAGQRHDARVAAASPLSRR